MKLEISIDKTLERQVLLELWDYDTIGDNDQIENARIQISEFRNRKKKISIDFRGVGKLYGQKVGKFSTEVLYQNYGVKQLTDKLIIQEQNARRFYPDTLTQFYFHLLCLQDQGIGHPDALH
ncbi:MAG: hypothetical protein EZS28_046843 [Streblomastix strix]|uniref:C2 domain-containing protein n=1 Tax=Streblomastix strix TaxID=222440 RepID=A0A5J4TIP5_9EUKA|nr:MAG: hypothetical protein EZS28_046843 [Streblomastix strix]